MNNLLRGRNINMNALWSGVANNRGKAFGFMILGALLAFEVFNFSTTEFALRDVLGDLEFAGVGWATILSLAFCGIDFAGVARLFTPEQGKDEPAEVWYLFGAWILAAGMNATLTWWGVAVAISNHSSMGSAVIGEGNLNKVVPVFVAVMVWVIRILIIGTFSVAGERLFSFAPAQQQVRRTQQSQSTYQSQGQYQQSYQQRPAYSSSTNANLRPASELVNRRPATMNASSSQSQQYRPAPKPLVSQPTYRQESMYPTTQRPNTVAKRDYDYEYEDE